MTVHRCPHAPISVLVDPGPAPQANRWDLELRGPLDRAALDHILGELIADGRERPVPRHQLLRHGPDHHTLRLWAAEAGPAALVSGRIADRLTEPPPAADHPLTTAQRALLASGGAHRYEAVLLETDAAPDAGALREALGAVLAAHPQLRSRLAADGWLTTRAGNGPAGRPDPLVEREFTDEAGFDAAVDFTGRTLDVRAGLQLRALLARDRRPAGPRADRLALVVHELAVDAASWPVLLDDLSAALDAAGAGRPARPRRRPGHLADWVGELRELAHDPAEARHWSLVAGRRLRTGDSHRPAPPAPPAPSAGPGAGPGQVRHTGFVLDQDRTERIVQVLARRLALTPAQVLTGVFALALARWQGSDEVSFDLRGDPRSGRPGLREHVGRLADPYPVHLTPDPGLDALGQLTALAGPLADCAGGAPGGAGFGACREWGPDPLLRRRLRELPPAPTCLSVPGPGELLPGFARPAHGSTPGRPAHPIEVRAQVAHGRLHITLDWATAPAHGVTDTTVAALKDLLRELLGELADAPAAPAPLVLRATPQQSALYTGGAGRPGTGRHVEQLVWLWHGPLDAARFAAAWQSVFDCETVLRTAFTGGGEPLLVVHDRVVPEITRRAVSDDDWHPFLERDRLRGFDLHCPALLRLTLLDAQPTPPDTTPAPTRILVSYHRALLDTWSAHLLLREFYRAYLAGGTLPGGERRPDLRDYTAWVAAQNPEPARGFWARSAPPDGAASRPGRPAATGLTGAGRARLRLDPADTARLARWAGTWGTAESSVLQAVWAMLIYWASGATQAAPVCFAVTVSGRGIPLDGAARIPGPLRNPLPMTVEVDPAGPVPHLLQQLRDRALEMSAYEWVPADWIRAWSHSSAHADTVIAFEDPPHPVQGLETELAAHGLGAEFPGILPAHSVLPVGLLAHHDSAGGLVLTEVHDRAQLGEEAAGELLAHSVLLLRELPLWADESTTVDEALQLLESSTAPLMADALHDGQDTPWITLRPARQDQAGTICLIPPPGAPLTCYDLLAHAYEGPQELLVLPTDAGPGGAPGALTALGQGPFLLLGGFSGAGARACDIARRIAADGHRPPRVVLAGATADEWERARELAAALNAATGRPLDADGA
ncbi:condensation domain-containing protein [Streptomyces sp. NBC_00445]|uniref:condensation domain-containing protein n=1 Tax=Streptomyces sp. NBC_00445 TaxID=2975745 RepID=UPI002E1C971A